MIRVRQLDQDLMRPWREAVQYDRISRCCRPVPRAVVEGHVNMPHARRNGKRRSSEEDRDQETEYAELARS